MVLRFRGTNNPVLRICSTHCASRELIAFGQCFEHDLYGRLKGLVLPDGNLGSSVITLLRFVVATKSRFVFLRAIGLSALNLQRQKWAIKLLWAGREAIANTSKPSSPLLRLAAMMAL
jgi:hypothetical protein